jgi:hypothetical protein
MFLCKLQQKQHQSLEGHVHLRRTTVFWGLLRPWHFHHDISPHRSFGHPYRKSSDAISSAECIKISRVLTHILICVLARERACQTIDDILERTASPNTTGYRRLRYRFGIRERSDNRGRGEDYGVSYLHFERRYLKRAGYGFGRINELR